MRNKILTVTWAAAALILAGCQIWNPGGVPFTAKNGAFTLRVPARWMFATAFGKDFTASKDGVILQQIVVEHVALKEALPHSKRELSPTLAPFELAEAVIDDLHSDHTLLSFTVKENTPATLGGKPAFHIVYSFRTEEKLRLTEEAYGAIVGDQLWLLRFRAPTRHYFERDRAVFAELVQSFVFTPQAARLSQ